MTKLHKTIAARLRHAAILTHEPDTVRTTAENETARDAWAVCVEQIAHALYAHALYQNASFTTREFMLACCASVADRNALNLT